MGGIMDAIGFLGLPGSIAVVIVALFLIMQIIGELTELGGKVVPEFLKIRKYFKRKREEKEKQAKLLERLAEKLESFEGHYNPDNIARRNEWMRGVDDRAVACGIQMADMTNTLLAAAKGPIRIGDIVRVSYPMNEQTNNPARKLNGQEFTVRSIHRVAESKNSKVTRSYYELYGAVSDRGVHYGFLEDELIKL